MVSGKLSLGNKSEATRSLVDGRMNETKKSPLTQVAVSDKGKGKLTVAHFDDKLEAANVEHNSISEQMNKAIKNVASGAAIGTSDPNCNHAHVPTDTITIAPANEYDVAYDPNKSRHTLMEAAHTAARALGNLITKLNEMPIDVKNRDNFKIAATTALKMIGFQEKDRNKDVDLIDSMTQTLMDEEDEWKDPSMVTTVEKRVGLCDK